MHCQLDSVKHILDVGSAVRKAMLDYIKKHPDMGDVGLISSSITCGLLLFGGLDAFIQQGEISNDTNTQEHTWVELYLDGEALIMDIFPGFNQQETKGDMILMLKEEAVALYNYGRDSEVEWKADSCPVPILQQSLNILNIVLPAQLVLEEIEALF